MDIKSYATGFLSAVDVEPTVFVEQSRGGMKVMVPLALDGTPLGTLLRVLERDFKGTKLEVLRHEPAYIRGRVDGAAAVVKPRGD